MRNDLVQIRPPLSKVVVNVNCRDACPFGSLFQPRDRLSYRQPKTQQFLATLKLKVVYDVDQ